MSSPNCLHPLRDIVHPKMPILKLITNSHVIPRLSFNFGTPIKIFFMKFESFLTLHRQQRNHYNQAQKGRKHNDIMEIHFYFTLSFGEEVHLSVHLNPKVETAGFEDELY